MDSEKKNFETVISKLSPQKRKVLEKLLAHQSYVVISQELQITDSTLRKHISAIYKDFAPFFSPASSRNSQSSLLALFDKFDYHPEMLQEATVASHDYAYVPLSELEAIAKQVLSEGGALLRLQAPPQWGKTEFISRMIGYCSQQTEIEAVYINFLETEKKDLQDLDSLLRWFCTCIIYKINSFGNSEAKEAQAQQFITSWEKGRATAKVKCANWFEDHLLGKSNSLALFLDHVDILHKEKAIAGDFLSMLRAWHDHTKIKPQWKKLKLVLAYTTEYINLNIYDSPFNVGKLINLPPLEAEQVQELAKQYGLDWQTSQVDKLMDLVAGHPYLIKLTLEHIANFGTSLEQIIAQALEKESIYREHLQGQLRLLVLAGSNNEDKEQLSNWPEQTATDTLKTICEENQLDKPNQDSQMVKALSDLGIVKLEDNQIIMSCKLYEQYFKRHLQTLK